MDSLLLRTQIAVAIILLCVLSACDTMPATQNDNRVEVLVTAIPTLNADNRDMLCSEVDANWAVNWPRAIEALESLVAIGETCTLDDASELSRLQSAYIAYGDELLEAGENTDARALFERAATLSPDDPALIARLESAGVRSRSEQCAETGEPLEPIMPTQGDFIQSTSSGFMLYDQPFRVYGVNYVPRDVHADRVLLDTNLRTIGVELDLMRAAGINTLRLVLPIDHLFACLDDILANESAFARLDGLISAAGQRGFFLILVVDVGELSVDAGIADPYRKALAFLADRYSTEPAVMAYDMRQASDPGVSARGVDLQPLANAAAIIREHAPQQFITSTWDDDAYLTAPIVDFVSFLMDGDVDALRQEIAILQDQTQKPILLATVGYDTVHLTEIEQRDALQQALEAVDRNNLFGWVLKDAFDHPVPLTCAEDEECSVPPESRFGIWNTSYYPKRAVDVIKLATGFNTRMEPESP